MNFSISTMNRQEFNQHIKKNIIYTEYYSTAAGTITVYRTEKGIYKTSFDHHSTNAPSLTDCSTLLLVGTDFQRAVWQAALTIPAGKTISYRCLAHMIGSPQSYRAVAQALAHNPIAYFVPCHRIIRNNGELGGYNYGIERKRMLLQAENKITKSDRGECSTQR